MGAIRARADFAFKHMLLHPQTSRQIQLAVDGKGKFLGLRVHTYAALGAYLS